MSAKAQLANQNMHELLFGRLDSNRKEAEEYKISQKIVIQNKLKNLRTEITKSRKYGTGPLQIFPEEVWTIILGHVTDCNDLASCASTCQLFESILRESKTQWLFGKIFLLILNHLGKIKALKCRLVCKQWRSGIDRQIESHNISSGFCEAGSDNPNAIKFDFRVGIPLYVGVPTTYLDYDIDNYLTDGDPLSDDEETDPSYDPDADEQYQEYLKFFREYPFIGRSVTVEPGYTESEEDPQFPDRFPRFLSKLGHHIWRFCISPKGDYEHKSPIAYYSVCKQSLVGCPNLRSISLGGKIDAKYHEQQNISVLQLGPLPDHAFLDTLEVTMDYPCTFLFQDKVMEKYCGQLKRVSVCLWNSTSYHNLEWGNLRELKINSELTDQICKSLGEMNCINLMSLGISLNEDKEGKLEQLLRLIRRYPELDTLIVNVSGQFTGFSDTEIIGLEGELRCFPSLTNLRIDISTSLRLTEISYNFLICFPRLQTFALAFRSSPANSLVFDTEEDDANPNTEFVQITKYLCASSNSSRKIYKSNIWEILPSLKTLQLNDTALLTTGYKLFTRSGYIGDKMERRALFIEHFKMAQKEAGRQRLIKGNLLRDRFKELRQIIGGDDEVQNARNAIAICTVESWLMILEYLRDDSGDLESCSKTCKLFEGLLETTKTQWLFGKIFHMIYNELDQQDICNCRSVCTSWRSEVDHFLESYYTVEESESKPESPFTGSVCEDNELDFNYIFRIPADLSFDYVGHDRVRDAMRLHSRNPFLGRSVWLNLTIREYPFEEGIPEEIQQFLDNFKEHIWHFNLWGRLNKTSIRPHEYYPLLFEILTKLRYLRSLDLRYFEVPWPHVTSGSCAGLPIKFAYENEPPLPNHSHLESLIVDDHNLHMSEIQDTLLEKYSKQLKCINSCFWNSRLYPKLEWDSLRELVLSTAEKCDKWLESLTKISAPNLTELHISLDGIVPKLNTLIAATNRFPLLEHLQLKFCEGFKGFSTEETLNMAGGFVSPPSLTYLHITLTSTCEISYDFLILFPYLKRLHIKVEEGNGDVQKAGKSKKIPGTEITAVEENDFIDLAKYFVRNAADEQQQNSMEMYKSNVWHFVPSLQFLRVCVNSSEETELNQTFTRLGYDHFNKKRLVT